MTVTAPVSFTPETFLPHPALAGGHRMTLYAWARTRHFARLPAAEPRLFRVADDTQVLGHCHWQRDRRRALTVILLHGLEGSSDGHYMRGMADKAFARGCNVVRLNQRNCGGTEHLCAGLYHSGLTADPLGVMRALARVVAVAAVSAPIELAVCVDALERAQNFAYHWNFLRGLRARMRRKAALFPGAWDTEPLRRIRSVRAFDDAYTAPYHGFDGAADYYHRASARRVLDRLAVPALLITAEDDPFVPATAACDPALDDVAALTRVVTRHGGHCGFVARPAAADDDGYWAERQVVAFLTAHDR